MPSISSALRMMDGMSGPLGKVIKQMERVIDSSERLNRVMANAGGSSNSLVPARTVSDQQRMVQQNQQIVQVTQIIQNNYKQINNTINQNNLSLQQTNNILNQTVSNQNRVNQGIREGKKESNALMRTLTGAAAAYLTFQTVKTGMNISDTYVNTLARIDMVNDGLQTTAELQEKIFAAADRARGSYTTMAGVIGKMGILASDAFAGNDELVAFTELMQKSFRVSGASTMEQQAGMYQLTQAMAAGKLQGDEFRSIMENAPMLAAAIADFTGKSKGELKEMSAEGTITADIIKGAMFAAADDIYEKFETMPRTFGDIWTEASNEALNKFGPVIERISKMLNSPGGEQFIANLQSAIASAAVAADWLLTAVTGVYGFISGNWSTIEPIIWGIAAATTAWGGINTAVTFAQTAATLGLATAWRALNAAQRANVFILLISLIVGLIVWLVKLWQTNDKFAAGLMRVWNAILNFFDRIPAYFWQLVEWLMNPFIWWAEKVGGIYDAVINGIIKGINTVLKLVNKITGSSYEIAAEFSVEKVAKGMKEFAQIQKEEAYVKAAEKAAEREQKVLDMLDDRAAKRAQKEAENAATNGNGFDIGKFGTPNINKVNEVGKINDSVDISSEDLKVMRDLAEMKAIQNFVTLTPTVEVTTGPITKEADVDEVIRKIQGAMETEMESSAKGLFT
jgi:tape measure domain-containing protein